MWKVKSVRRYADYVMRDENGKPDLDIDNETGKSWDDTVDVGEITDKTQNGAAIQVLAQFGFNEKEASSLINGFDILDDTSVLINVNYRIKQDKTYATKQDIENWKRGRCELWDLDIMIELTEEGDDKSNNPHDPQIMGKLLFSDDEEDIQNDPGWDKYIEW